MNEDKIKEYIELSAGIEHSRRERLVFWALMIALVVGVPTVVVILATYF